MGGYGGSEGSYEQLSPWQDKLKGMSELNKSRAEAYIMGAL